MLETMKTFLNTYKKTDLPKFKVGDVVRVYQEIEEGNKKRLQPFEGLVIARKHGQEIGATFTVRKIISGIGTEKIFPLHSPIVKKIEIIKRARKVRRAKLYWVRKKTAREIQKKLKLEQQNNKHSSAPLKSPEKTSNDTHKEAKK